jgi:PAS domain-containing protein
MELKIFGNLKIRTLLISTLSLVFLWVIVVSYISNQNLQKVSTESYTLNDEIKTLKKYSSLDTLAQKIVYYDEVLTQSARNYAFTIDPMWRERYYIHIPLLEGAISQAIKTGDLLEKNLFLNLNEANNVLVELEQKSINLTDKGDSKSAVMILKSEEYWTFKEEYQKNIAEYLSKREVDHKNVLDSNILGITSTSKNLQKIVSDEIRSLIILILILIPTLVFIVYYFEKKLSNPIVSLVETIDSISNGDFKSYKIAPEKGDLMEISKLKKSLARIIKTMKLAVLESMNDPDISYQEAIEISKKNEMRFKILADTVPAIFYSAKASGNFDATFISKSIEAFGYNPREFTLIPGFWMEQIHPDDKINVNRALKKLLLKGSVSYRYKFKKKDGSYSLIQDYSRLIKDSFGKPVEIIGMMFEIFEENSTSGAPSNLKGKNNKKGIQNPNNKIDSNKSS